MTNNKSVDSLRKQQAPLKLKDILWTGVNRTHYSTSNPFTWHLEPLLKSLRFNSVQGLVINVSADFQQFLKKSKTNLTVTPNFSYGFSDNQLYAWLDVNFRTRDWSIDKKLKRENWSFSGGRRLSQFNKESNVSSLGNSIGTLFYGNNYMKIYENKFGNITFGKRFENGWRLTVDGIYEDREPLTNTTDFVLLTKKKDKITPNYPYEVINGNFTPHHAVLLNVSVSVKPGQRYIQFPFNKVPIGSKYPTFTLNYTKGIKGIFGSSTDFDKWNFVVNDDVNLKLAGTIKYKAMVGGFLNTNNVYIQDYQHFNGNKSHLAKEYLNTFQLQSYYQNSTTTNFFTAVFFEHHYNGLLTNKIPLFKKLNWHFVDGANFLYLNSGTPYAEVFAGLENIFKVLRIDFIAGLQNGYKPNFDIKIGTGGLIGGRVNTKRVSGSRL